MRGAMINAITGMMANDPTIQALTPGGVRMAYLLNTADANGKSTPLTFPLITWHLQGEPYENLAGHNAAKLRVNTPSIMVHVWTKDEFGNQQWIDICNRVDEVMSSGNTAIPSTYGWTKISGPIHQFEEDIHLHHASSTYRFQYLYTDP